MKRGKKPKLGGHPRCPSKRKQRSDGVKKAARAYNTRLNIRKGR